MLFIKFAVKYFNMATYINPKDILFFKVFYFYMYDYLLHVCATYGTCTCICMHVCIYTHTSPIEDPLVLLTIEPSLQKLFFSVLRLKSKGSVC